MIRVIVTGSRFVAMRAAELHGIQDAKFMPSGSSWRESVLHVPDTHLLTVAEWFSEPGNAPFPPGTCLHWASLDGGRAAWR